MRVGFCTAEFPVLVSLHTVHALNFSTVLSNFTQVNLLVLLLLALQPSEGEDVNVCIKWLQVVVLSIR
jgi:hypothetical protein